MLHKATAYCDVNNNGNSTIDKIYDDSLKIDYTLRPGPYVYAGFYFAIYNSEPLLDFSKYDTVRIKLSELEDHQWFISFSIKTGKSSTYYPELTEYKRSIVFDSTDVRESYDIPIKNIQVEEWMLKEYRDLKNTPDKLKDVACVSIFDSAWQFPDGESKGSLEIKEITFIKKSKLFYIVLGISILFYYIIFFLLYILQRKTHIIKKFFLNNNIFIKAKPMVYYSPLDVQNYSTLDLNKIMDYINDNYSDPEISAEKIHEETGIPVYRITGLIREKYNCSFRKLLNNIRLTEAKRLLKQSDLYVNDIVFRVGYGNVVYFNRIFKEVVGVSPTMYRKQSLQKTAMV